MTERASAAPNVSTLDETTRELVELAVVIAAGNEGELRSAMTQVASGNVPPEWVEELVLQSYLFAGFPRTLNASREWRRASGRAAPSSDSGTDYSLVPHWTREGERTCGIVYGDMYERLRRNVNELHPALDAWMIVDGYGKVLSRPGLDLRRRELCILAVCAATAQERQLHSHLHGALHAGAGAGEVEAALRVALPRVPPAVAERYLHLWSRVERGS
jgi:4-carboxymuconolactone decarboxylase